MIGSQSMFRAPPRTIVAIVGPTASGKTDFGYKIADSLPSEIVCLDSVQLYQGFDVGSSKPTLDERGRCPHHLFDQFSWAESCDAATYARLAARLIEDILLRNRIPILIGGTGLYLRALLGQSWSENLPSNSELRSKFSQRASLDLWQELQLKDPKRAAKLHSNDRYRVIRALEIHELTGKTFDDAARTVGERSEHNSINCFLVFCDPPRQELHSRIQLRVEMMIAQGLEAEVQRLRASGVDPACKPMQSIGYKQVNQMLSGEITRLEMPQKIVEATRQYAKRQVTWFKKLNADYVIQDFKIDHVPACLSLLR